MTLWGSYEILEFFYNMMQQKQCFLHLSYRFRF